MSADFLAQGQIQLRENRSRTNRTWGLNFRISRIPCLEINLRSAACRISCWNTRYSNLLPRVNSGLRFSNADNFSVSLSLSAQEALTRNAHTRKSQDSSAQPITRRFSSTMPGWNQSLSRQFTTPHNLRDFKILQSPRLQHNPIQPKTTHSQELLIPDQSLQSFQTAINQSPESSNSRGQPMAIRLWRTSGKATEEVAAGTRKRIAKATESASVRGRGHGGNHPQPSRISKSNATPKGSKQTNSRPNKQEGKPRAHAARGRGGGRGWTSLVRCLVSYVWRVSDFLVSVEWVTTTRGYWLRANSGSPD